MKVTLVGRPGPHSTAFDTPTGIRFSPGVTVDVDDPGIEGRLKSIESLGFSFWFGDPAALTVVSPDDVPVAPAVAPDPADLTPPAPAAPTTPAASASATQEA